jgi:hypothetical protein
MNGIDIAITGSIQAVVGFGVWFAVRRPIDELSAENQELRRDIKALADHRVASIESRQAEHERRFPDLVSAKTCMERHRELAEAQREFHGAVVDLAAAQQKLEDTAQFVSEVNQRVISALTDMKRIDAIERRVERVEDRKS